MKNFLIIIFFLFLTSNSFADNTYFIDFGKVLNNSKAGGAAQDGLKKQFQNQSVKFKKAEEGIRKEESQIIAQKSTITKEEYLSKINTLRKKVADLQKNKQDSFKKITAARKSAKISLLKTVNPIIKKYMEENNIRLVLDKKSVLMGDENLEITDQIITILNKNVSSLKIN